MQAIEAVMTTKKSLGKLKATTLKEVLTVKKVLAQVKR